MLPADLRTTRVFAGLDQPTDFDFLPDGRVLVAERAGTIRVLENGGSRASSFLRIPSRVSTARFRGLVDVTVDPDFARYPFIYLVYAAERAGAPPDEPTTARVSRFTVRDDEADPESEKVLLGTSAGPSCAALPSTFDCLPADADHIGADIAFAEDGSLFVATGEGGGLEQVEQTAFLAQDIDSLAGKILRVDRDGRGLEDNPFWNGDPAANRSKIWALGFRNPFRLALEPHSALLVAGDVGWDRYEELNLVTRRKDYGWPCLEGLGRTPRYRTVRFCRDYYARHADRAVAPTVAMAHPSAGSVTAGAFLREATLLPERYRSQYLFGDWLVNKLWLTTIDDKPGPASVRAIGRNAAGPVTIRVGPDGAVYYLALNLGELRRISAS